MNKEIFKILWFLPLLYSCKGHNENHYVRKDSIPSVKYIPYYEDSVIRHSGKEVLLAHVANLMRQPPLTNGTNSLYARVWIWGSEKHYVVNIDDASKECNITEFSVPKTDSGDFIAIHQEWKNITPQSGWNNFIDTLNKYQIPFLKSGTVQNVRKDFLTHMGYVQFEIAQPSSYKFYEYLEPSFYRNVDTESNKVDHFLNFLDKELNVEMYESYRTPIQ